MREGDDDDEEEDSEESEVSHCWPSPDRTPVLTHALAPAPAVSSWPLDSTLTLPSPPDLARQDDDSDLGASDEDCGEHHRHLQPEVTPTSTPLPLSQLVTVHPSHTNPNPDPSRQALTPTNPNPDTQGDLSDITFVFAAYLCNGRRLPDSVVSGHVRRAGTFLESVSQSVVRAKGCGGPGTRSRAGRGFGLRPRGV